MPKGDPLKFELDDEDLKLFLEEAEEQLELLDTALVQLEGEPEQDLVQQIFRAAHTLKGSSATIGHRKMASLTHAMETVLDAVRQERIQPNTEIVDALLGGLDTLRVLSHEVVTKVDSGVDPTPLEQDLLSILESELDTTGQADEEVASEASLVSAFTAEAMRALLNDDEGREALHVRVTVDPDCPLPGIRCFQVLQELDVVGTVASVVPPREVLEAGDGEFSVEAVITTLSGQEHLATVLGAIPDVTVAIEEFATDGSSATDAEEAAASAPG
ncbi:MAG: Hpt domain-containing protein, partial [Dehalococcoidia bacterium]|nr:Hpt domain-containing protein [Dehalococcoidia bacterium]